DIAYALRHNETLIAIMAISSGARALTPEKRAVLDVLSGQVALHIESCLLLEQKFQLERKLAARERLASLGQMAATIAHEVKNPLSSIKSIAQVMREDDRLSDYRLDLDLIVGEMDRLSSTVSRLLSFSKPDAIGNASAPHVSLSKLVAGTVALFTHDADDRHQIIEVKPGSDVALPGWMATPLQEVIGNLLLNAIQASPDEGRVTVDYIIESESRDTAEPGGNNDQSGAGLQASERVVTLSVIDEGPGVSAELQDSIFDPFFTTKPRGTGLGLSIVRRRLNELGGSISVESPMAHGKGASFVVTLHLAGIHSEHTAVCDPS
ncbi:MAG TPA: ATP-binding protein, partial [Blastocatellia bacterium]